MDVILSLPKDILARNAVYKIGFDKLNLTKFQSDALPKTGNNIQ